MQRYKDKMCKRWWLFNAMDFQSLMHPCFIFCRIIGMFPYKINVSTFEASKPCYILSTLIVCICCIIDVIIIHDFYIFKINLGPMVRSIEGICYFTCSGVIMISTHVLCGPRMRLLQTILEISSKLPRKSYQELSRLIHVKDILGTIWVIIQMRIYFYNSREINYLNFVTKAFLVYCILLIFHLNMLYVNCICILKICFKSINDNLMHIQRSVINGTIPRIPTSICHMQKNQVLLMELKTLKKQHLMISDAVKMLQVIFSPQLLATIVIIISDITFEWYYCAVKWQNGSLLISFNEHLFVMFLCCIIDYGILLMFLVWACETCKNQAYEIHTTIHDLLNNIIDEQIKEEVVKMYFHLYIFLIYYSILMQFFIKFPNIIINLLFPHFCI